MQTLKSIKLINYKGFERHTISLRGTNVLIGANNAGKSTALGALRLIAAMLPTARRTAPTTVGTVEGRSVRGWPITAAAIDSSAVALENVRHDFRNAETRIEVACSSGARVVASWEPVDDADGPPPAGIFTIYPPSNTNPPMRTVAQNSVPKIAVVPTLTPLDQHESFVTVDTLRRHASGRRAPRYFRNSLFRLSSDEWHDFCGFVYERTPELYNLTLNRSYGNDKDAFDLFYEEEGSRNEREIGWAGDGIQIWLQALYHLWRQGDVDVVVLDEPDVFLHPDLQRRLARTLFAARQQTVLATHSVEILAEADPGSAVWIDRSRRNAERPRTDGALALLGRRLGSGYELGVGRALRSRTVLFVEGDDAPILATWARTLGRSAVARSENYATVPLGGFSKNWRAGAFTETISALGGDVASLIILDGDLRSEAATDAEVAQIRSESARVHVWARRELENYVLEAAAIAKVAGVSLADATTMLEAAIEAHRTEAAIALQAQRLDERRLKDSATAGHSERTVLEATSREFDALWATGVGRVSTVDAKLVIKALNRSLAADKKRTLNVQTLARATPAAKIPDEVTSVISQLDDMITRS
ncbi:ATP-dependent nuclease [Microbacterium proteolyticum]|uniref:ATP-dependent nuclease n=1 Tax=Microbacterium proteolyticum TaxID=1572644 RepID=UPI001FACD830|nr:ATP-binding protein [Microbacterium proteolyticum]MCI9859360.1 AAA family ATPase [Microbacterium proteolyticum]